VSTGLPLGSYELSAPDTWAAIPEMESEPGWEKDVADLLCDTEQTQAALAALLKATHADLIADTHLLVAVWVPDRSVSEIVGLMTVDWILPEEGQLLDISSYRDLVDSDPRRGLQALDRHIDEVEIPAGEALLVREVIARSDSRSFPQRTALQENVIYTVFPPGCSEALELTFSTFVLELAADAAAVLDSLHVRLAEVSS
jgi:hypothetical protein